MALSYRVISPLRDTRLATLARLIPDPIQLQVFLGIHRAAQRFIVPDVYSGPHADVAMYPFIHPTPSRFSDGTRYGVLYAGDALQTAIAERRFHDMRSLRDIGQP